MINKTAQFKNDKNNKTRVLFILSVIVFICSLISRLYISGKFAVKNDDLQTLYNRKIAIEKEISILEYKDSLLSSIKTIDDRAKALGFMSFEKNILALDLDAPVTVAILSTR